MESWINAREGRLRIQPMLDFRRVVKNRKIQPEAAFCPTKNQGLEWMNSNPRMQVAKIIHLWRAATYAQLHLYWSVCPLNIIPATVG